MDVSKYINLISTDDVEQIITPLKSLGISYFLYTFTFADGSRATLTNHAEWEEHYYAYHFDDISAFEQQELDFVEGWHLWKTLPGQEVFQAAKEYFDLDHGITKLKYLPNNTNECFHFAAPSNRRDVLNHYLNCSQDMERFIVYFRQVAAKLIDKAKANRHLLPTVRKEGQRCGTRAEEISCQCQQFRAQLAEMQSPGDVRLTKREMECVCWLKQGKSSDEIGCILSISKRTVEAHVENIKKKYRCYKQFRLGYLIGKDSEIFVS